MKKINNNYNDVSMKKYIDKIIGLLCFVSLVVLSGCDEYDRTEVKSAITVNIHALNLIVGDETQVTAGPQDGRAFTWTSEDQAVVSVSNGLVKALAAGVTNILVQEGDMHVRIPVTVEERIPLTGIEFSVYELELIPGQKITMIPMPVPANANDVAITDFSWWSDDESIARVSPNGNVTGFSEGFTKIHYRKGNFTTSLNVAISYTRPFKGPHIISAEKPYILPLRDFDVGGEGYGFHESDAGSSTGNNYRKDNGDGNSVSVDIENGYSIGYTNNGEWLLYTVEVLDAGTYNVRLNASGGGGPGAFHIEVDGEDKTGEIEVPNIGAWSNWTWYPEAAPLEIYLPEGKQKIKFVIDRAGYNIVELKFEYKK